MSENRPDYPESLLSRIRWRNGQGGSWHGSGIAQAPGSSGEFEGHRQWQSGEDLQNLDLKVWQRLRQRWIREYRQEADEPLHVVIDSAPSMTFGARKTALQHLRTLLKGVASQSRVPHREWLIEETTLKPISGSDISVWGQRVSLNQVLPRFPRTLSNGRVIVISDRLTFDELTHFNGFSPVRQLQWWSLWLEEETDPSWKGDLSLSDPSGRSWQSHFDAKLLEKYRHLMGEQILILQDWLNHRGGVHVTIPAVTSASRILENLTGSRGPLKVVSG